MHIVAVPALGIIFNILVRCIEANLALDFKVTRISVNHKAANCNVANTTYAHGETFKLDCKTQCVCENGRHACSSLCPKEQLPAPEDTISCRSPRLVEVPGHCCKMWLCENPTADVYATCHNSSTSPWTPCRRVCGLGISTRFTTTTAGCNQLSNLRLCENRKCETERPERVVEKYAKGKQNYLMKTKQLKQKLKRPHQQQKHQHHHHHAIKHQQQLQQEHVEHEHRIRKGHECRSLQRLGPARVRLGQCVSKKLYRPKICGRCHQDTKCCVPSVSTTIQVELLCPLNAMDPISFVQQQLNTEQRQQQNHHFYPKATISSKSLSSLTSLWDTESLDALDQEYLQSHQIQIANKFIAVEWILKCECTKNDNCQRIVNATTATRDDHSNQREGSSNKSNHKYHDYDDSENVDTDDNNLNNKKNMQSINYFKLNHYNNNMKNSMHYKEYKEQTTTQIDKIPDDNKNVDEHVDVANDDDNDDDDDDDDVNANKDDGDNDSDININNSYTNTHMLSFNNKKQTKDYDENNKINNSNNKNNMINNKINVDADDDGEEIVEQEGIEKKTKEWLSSDEIQPDIIPYPPPPFSANKHTQASNNNNNKNTQTNVLKEKSKPEHSKPKKRQQKNHHQQQHQQEYYEHWLLKQYNNKPYQEASSLAT